MSIKYVIGDATEPQGTGNKIIAHVCNDLGLWGSGFVLAVSSRWPNVKDEYVAWARGNSQEFGLGHVQFVQVENDIWVANMVAQRGVRNSNNPVPLDLNALYYCFWKVSAKIWDIRATVHMPRIGCGLAGGKWPDVEKVINRYGFADKTTVYDLE